MHDIITPKSQGLEEDVQNYSSNIIQPHLIRVHHLLGEVNESFITLHLFSLELLKLKQCVTFLFYYLNKYFQNQ